MGWTMAELMASPWDELLAEHDEAIHIKGQFS